MLRRLIVVAVLAAPWAAWAAVCDSPAELSARQVRQVQVEAMVAALKCQGTGADVRGLYGEFLHRSNAALNQNAAELRALFARRGKGAAAVDRYMTELSNEAQLRSSHIDDYCGVSTRRLEELADLAPARLPAFAAAAIGMPYDGDPCPVVAAKPKHKAKP